LVFSVEILGMVPMENEEEGGAALKEFERHPWFRLVSC
jgi:hypothetical protein